jgi:hypothetical protein
MNTLYPLDASRHYQWSQAQASNNTKFSKLKHLTFTGNSLSHHLFKSPHPSFCVRFLGTVVIQIPIP